jgi:hypothetical protein
MIPEPKTHYSPPCRQRWVSPLEILQLTREAVSASVRSIPRTLWGPINPVELHKFLCSLEVRVVRGDTTEPGKDFVLPSAEPFWATHLWGESSGGGEFDPARLPGEKR